jgi:hypothetical protein
MDSKEKRIKKVKRDIILTCVFLGIIEIAVLFFLFYKKAYTMLWAPFVFLGVLAFALYMDFNKIKLIKEEKEEIKEEPKEKEEIE